MFIYIGKIKFIEQDSEDFDRLVLGETSNAVLNTIKAEYLDLCNGLEEFEARDALLKVSTLDELTKWFENHFAAYKFEIEVFNV